MKILALIALLLLTGCEIRDSHKHLVDGVTIMTDSEGKKWAISHNIGTTYYIQEVK